MKLRTCCNCFEQGYNGKIKGGNFVCSTCLEYNDINYSALKSIEEN